MIEIKLELEEINRALSTAYERWSLSTRDKKKDSYTWTDGLMKHFYGCVGEMACAKYLDRYWSGHVNQYKGGKADIGMDIEVRHRIERDKDLIIEKNDPPNRVYVLTRGIPPDIEVVGWYSKEMVKKSHLKKMRFREVYCIPEPDLLDLKEIK